MFLCASCQLDFFSGGTVFFWPAQKSWTVDSITEIMGTPPYHGNLETRKNPVARDAPTKEAVGAEDTVWEAMMEF